MEKVKILIVEDEFFIAKDISIRLQDIGYVISGIASSVKEAWLELESQRPDLCIIDIQLNGAADGISLAHQINDRCPMPVIFLTSYKDAITIAKAREARPAAYMLKPFNDQELQIAIDLAISNYSKNQVAAPDYKKNTVHQENLFFMSDCIFVRKRERFYRVNYTSILWVEAQSNYALIVTEKEKYTLAITLGKVSEKLLAPVFLRVSRSFIVNLNKVDSLEGNSIFIKGKIISVSKKNKILVFQHFNML